MQSFLAEEGSDSQRDVLYFDEGRFGLKTETGRRWGKRGSVIEATVSQSYENFYAYSSVSPLTGLCFSLFLPWVNTEMMSLYLSELSKAYPDKEFLIIWDGAGWHHSQALVIPDNIQVHFLPPYSPELNPVERLWRWLRRHVTRNRVFETNELLMLALEIALQAMTADELMTLCHCSYINHIN